MVGARPVGVFLRFFQQTITQSLEFLFDRDVHFARHFLVWFVERWKPTAVRFRFALRPNLARLVGFAFVGIDEIETFVARNRRRTALFAFVRLGSVFDINGVFVVAGVGFAQINRYLIVFVGVFERRCAVFERHFLDVKVFSIQRNRILWIEIRLCRNPDFAQNVLFFVIKMHINLGVQNVICQRCRRAING